MTTLHAGPTDILLHAAKSFGEVNTIKIQYTLVDEAGNTLVDEAGNILVSDYTDAQALVLHAGATEILLHAES